MKTKFLKDEFAYDGSQLRALYAFQEHDIEGESLVSWLGSCDVSNENMKDGEDLFAGESIASSKMIHFIMEVFEQPLMTMVSLQRLLSSVAGDTLAEMSGEKIVRDGDDLFFESGKLSISIATRGAVSSMIHFAVNVSNEGTPVKTASLEDLKIDHEVFASSLLKNWEKEYAGIVRATKKVFAI